MTPPPPRPPGVVQVRLERGGGFQLLRNGEILCVVHPKYPRVEKWKLVQQDTAIAIKSRGDPYGPAAIELFDVDTGELKEKVMTYGIAAGRPQWARGFEDAEIPSIENRIKAYGKHETVGDGQEDAFHARIGAKLLVKTVDRCCR
jgi:hypothetical protein